MTRPALPASIGLLPASPSGLLLATPAGTGSFRIHGRRARVRGIQLEARVDIELDGRPCVKGLQAVRGAAVNVLLHPGLARRELAGPRGTCLETIVTAPSLPFVAVQWSAAGPGAPTEVTFEIPGNLGL